MYRVEIPQGLVAHEPEARLKTLLMHGYKILAYSVTDDKQWPHVYTVSGLSQGRGTTERNTFNIFTRREV